MKNFHVAAIGIVLSIVCSVLSIATVEVIAIKGIEIAIGSEPIKSSYQADEYEKLLAEHQVRIEEYKINYLRNNDTWLKRHKTYLPHSWKYTWWAWMLPALLWRLGRWYFPLWLLPVPIVLTASGVFLMQELFVFLAILVLTFFLQIKLYPRGIKSDE